MTLGAASLDVTALLRGRAEELYTFVSIGVEK